MLFKHFIVATTILAQSTEKETAPEGTLTDSLTQVLTNVVESNPVKTLFEPVVNGIASTANNEINAFAETFNISGLRDQFKALIEQLYPNNTMSIIVIPGVGAIKLGLPGSADKAELDMDTIMKNSSNAATPIIIKTIARGINNVIPNQLTSGIHITRIQGEPPAVLDRPELGLFNPAQAYTGGPPGIFKRASNAASGVDVKETGPARNLQQFSFDKLPLSDITVLGARIFDEVIQVPLQILAVPAVGILNGDSMPSIMSTIPGQLANAFPRELTGPFKLISSGLGGVLNTGAMIANVPGALASVPQAMISNFTAM